MAIDLAKARADIESTTDLLVRAMKLSGLITTLFREQGFRLGGSGKNRRVAVVQGVGGTQEAKRGNGQMSIKWEDWLSSLERKRAILKKYGVDAPSRRKTSFNTSERFMRMAFGGARVPAFAQEGAR